MGSVPGAEAARSAQSTLHDASIEDQVLVLQILGESDVEHTYGTSWKLVIQASELDFFTVLDMEVA